MEKKRRHLLIDEPIRMVGLAFALLVVFLLWFSQDVRANPQLTGTVMTSKLKQDYAAGQDLDLGQDVTIVVDQDFTAGELFTGTHNLTIEGNGNATLTLKELSTATSSAGGAITIKSGKVHINCTTSTSSAETAIYCAKRITISGGELTVTNRKRQYGIECGSLYISGGKLKIAMNKGTGSSITGIYVMKDGAFSMSGGELNIDVSGVTGINNGASMNGLYLSNNSKGVITGGKTYISAAYTTGTGDKIMGIAGASGSSLSISGGSVWAQGYSTGIRNLSLEISGDALVTAKATSAAYAGIHVNNLKLSGRPIVRAEGGKSAIIAFGMDPLPKTLVITEPKNGMFSKTSTSRYEVVTSLGPPSPTAVIDYVDNPGTVTVSATPSVVVKGKAATVTCKASMSGYAHDVGFSWSLAGNKSASTMIDAGGILHIAADEASGGLIVTAAAKANMSICGSAVITLIERPEKAQTEKETESLLLEKQKQKEKTNTRKEEKIVIRKSPSSVKAKAKKNRVTVTWKKIKKNKAGKKLLKQIRSIQVQYSTDKRFEQNVKSKNVGKKKTKVKLKLRKKTTYYVRVRYVGKDGVSRWSKVKRVRTK